MYIVIAQTADGIEKITAHRSGDEAMAQAVGWVDKSATVQVLQCEAASLRWDSEHKEDD